MNWLLSVLLACGIASAQAETFSFALIGDVPYSDYERAQLPLLLERIGERQVSFIAHIGDIKSGRTRCDDALYLDRKAVFEASRSAFIYLPGDNEWTDCQRLPAGGYDQEERLGFIRRVFFAEPRSLGQRPIALERQAGEYAEHVRFKLGPVLFVGLNVPGGNNNIGPEPEGSREYRKRNPAVLAWIRESFDKARKDKLPGIVLMMQADPSFEAYAKGLPYGGYRALLDTLREESLRFGGQVVLVHGDTHWSRIDQPLKDRTGGKTIDNFTRVETHGYPVMGWTLGIIDTDIPRLFRFTPYGWPDNAP